MCSQAAGLSKLVEYNKKKVEELHLQELKASLAETIAADPPLPQADAITLVQDKKKEWALPDLEITKVLICIADVQCRCCTLDIRAAIATSSVHIADHRHLAIHTSANKALFKFWA